MRMRDNFGATSTPAPVPADDTLIWIGRWHQAAQRYIGTSLGQGATPWVMSLNDIQQQMRQSNANAPGFEGYKNAFVDLVDQIFMALQPPAIAWQTCWGGASPARSRCPWKEGIGRISIPSMRKRLRACIEGTAGLAVAKVHRFATIKQAADTIASLTKIPFNRGYGTELNTYLGLEVGVFFAWEDAHVVTVESPEAEWYWANGGNVWTKEYQGKIVGGDMGSGCSGPDRDYSHRVWSTSTIGHDPCDIGRTILDSIYSYTMSAGLSVDLAVILVGAFTSIMSTGAQSRARLQTEMITKRNIWCYVNGITPPSYPQIAREALVADPPDKVAAQFAMLAPVPGQLATAPASGGLAMVLASAAAGFAVGGPPGAGIGAGVGLVLNMAAQKK